MTTTTPAPTATIISTTQRPLDGYVHHLVTYRGSEYVANVYPTWTTVRHRYGAGGRDLRNCPARRAILAAVGAS